MPDTELFDGLGKLTTNRRSVVELQKLLDSTVRFAGEPVAGPQLQASQRTSARADWFRGIAKRLDGCDLIFADPDNGLVDDLEHRRNQGNFGKRLPLSEARALSENRTAVIYHHNSRFKGGHDAEVDHWLHLLGPNTIAIRAAAFSCRTFFIINPDLEIKNRALEFCQRWRSHKVWMHRGR